MERHRASDVGSGPPAQTALESDADTPPTGRARPRPAPAPEVEPLTVPVEVAPFEADDTPPTSCLRPSHAMEIATRRVLRPGPPSTTPDSW